MQLYSFDAKGKCTIEEKKVKNLTLKQLNKLWKEVQPDGEIFREGKTSVYNVVYDSSDKCYTYNVSNLYILAVRLKLMTEQQMRETRGY